MVDFSVFPGSKVVFFIARLNDEETIACLLE